MALIPDTLKPKGTGDNYDDVMPSQPRKIPGRILPGSVSPDLSNSKFNSLEISVLTTTICMVVTNLLWWGFVIFYL